MMGRGTPQYIFVERRRPIGPLVGAAVAVVGAVLFVVAAVAALGAIVTALVAYVKREDWTLPAYRWTRDKTGQWGFTPWSAQSETDATVAGEAD
jgi:hypothetical protein